MLPLMIQLPIGWMGVVLLGVTSGVVVCVGVVVEASKTTSFGTSALVVLAGISVLYSE